MNVVVILAHPRHRVLTTKHTKDTKKGIEH